MKSRQLVILVSVILSMFCFTQCSDLKKQEITLIGQLNLISHSMKGWELYSWPKGKYFYYSLLIGTNRSKTYEEVIANKLQVSGKDSLKLLLNKFPENESLFWFGAAWSVKNSGSFALPDEKTVNEIKAFCSQKKLTLMVGE
jgi:hypothetical protein